MSLETFASKVDLMSTHYNQLEQTSFVHTLYIEGHEHNYITYNGRSYQQVQYYKGSMAIANFARELNIPVFLHLEVGLH